MGPSHRANIRTLTQLPDRFWSPPSEPEWPPSLRRGNFPQLLPRGNREGLPPWDLHSPCAPHQPLYGLLSTSSQTASLPYPLPQHPPKFCGFCLLNISPSLPSVPGNTALVPVLSASHRLPCSGLPPKHIPEKFILRPSL